LIRAQAKALPYEQVYQTFLNMQKNGIEPTVPIYTSLMVACGQSGLVLEAEKILAEMKQRGLSPNLWTYTALARVYGKGGQLDRAFSVVDLAKADGVSPNVVLYTTLIHACLTNGDIVRAWDTFDNMRIHLGIEPDEVTFSLMIHACSLQGQAERAANLLEEMKILQRRPTEVTYNSQINAYAKRKDFYLKAFEMFGQMKANGYQPTIETFGTLLHACAQNADIKGAERVWDEMIANHDAIGPPNLTIWNTLLSVYANAQKRANAIQKAKYIEKAHLIAKKIKEAELKPDIITLNTILSIYARAHHIRSTFAFFRQNFRTVATLADDIKSLPNKETTNNNNDTINSNNNNNINNNTSNNSNESNNNNTNTKIKINNNVNISNNNNNTRAYYTPKTAILNKELIVVDTSNNSAGDGNSNTPALFVPDVTTFTTLIQMCAETRRPEDALAMWKEMKSGIHRVEPNMLTYEYMVKALARGQYINTCMKTLREMRSKGYIPNKNVVMQVKNAVKQYPDLLAEVKRLTTPPPVTQIEPTDQLARHLKEKRKRDKPPVKLGIFAPLQEMLNIK